MKKLSYIFFVFFFCSFIVNTARGSYYVDHHVTKNEPLKVFKKLDKQISLKSEENEPDSNTPLKNKKRKRPKGTETNGHLIHEHVQHVSYDLSDFIVYFYSSYCFERFYINGKRGPPAFIA